MAYHFTTAFCCAKAGEQLQERHAATSALGLTATLQTQLHTEKSVVSPMYATDTAALTAVTTHIWVAKLTGCHCSCANLRCDNFDTYAWCDK